MGDVAKIEVQAEDGTWVVVETITKRPEDRWNWGAVMPIDLLRPRVRLRYEELPTPTKDATP
jgi:hypothetical protein